MELLIPESLPAMEPSPWFDGYPHSNYHYGESVTPGRSTSKVLRYLGRDLRKQVRLGRLGSDKPLNLLAWFQMFSILPSYAIFVYSWKLSGFHCFLKSFILVPDPYFKALRIRLTNKPIWTIEAFKLKNRFSFKNLCFLKWRVDYR